MCDRLFYGGEIHTVNSENTVVEAMWIRGKTVAGVGTLAELEAAVPADAERIFLDGRAIVPGFQDSHIHFNQICTRSQPEELPWEERFLRGIPVALKQLAACGLTTVQEAGCHRGEFELLRQFQQKGNLTCRIRLMTRYPEMPWDDAREDEMLQADTVKLNVDGLSSDGTCATRLPRPGKTECSPPRWEQEALNDAVRKIRESGFRATAHAIGDRAVEMLLDAYRASEKIDPENVLRCRVEHATFCPPDLIERIREQKIFPVLNPGFPAVWGDRYPAFYGELTEHLVPLQAVLDAGICCAIGSDSPAVPQFAPLWQMAAAMERRSPGGICFGESSLSSEELLRCCTANAAYLSGEESTRGSLESGKVADFVILSGAFRGADADRLKELSVEETWLNGERIYRKSEE